MLHTPLLSFWTASQLREQWLVPRHCTGALSLDYSLAVEPSVLSFGAAFFTFLLAFCASQLRCLS